VACRRLGAEDAVTPLDHVEVDLEDAALGHDVLDHHRDQRLLSLAQGRALSRQEEVLGQLLRNGRTARHDPAFLPVFLARLLDGLPVEAFVVGKLGVFRHHHRALQARRDAIVGDPEVL
jgi:hypothetical protein